MKNLFTERTLFFTKFLQSPGNIGSVLPSSRFLVQAMLKPVDWQQTRTLVELGAGTGVLTRHIQEQIHPNCRVAVFEQDPELREKLRQTFPRYRHYSRAEELGSGEPFPPGQVDCVLSSLPFFNFPPEKREIILEAIFRSLKKGGIFVTYQYSLQMKRELSRLFHLKDVRFVPLNIPCAFVYVCQKP
ncbi:phospholipid N-methyltransferase [Melghirimyces profundicolus]|uniref:Phospholipid N-methyltransferase n=1 Tax=Melghirimyces profundicolus TaxID=1242148 RepID=A0A2T6BW26_9BACL|nr:methyltransferase domain-containing protein [Melghirimyces profundicolus]PTX60290.1 phospholipid N-methyltransferase [Melghirimyces profundicolus]